MARCTWRRCLSLQGKSGWNQRNVMAIASASGVAAVASGMATTPHLSPLLVVGLAVIAASCLAVLGMLAVGISLSNGRRTAILVSTCVGLIILDLTQRTAGHSAWPFFILLLDLSLILNLRAAVTAALTAAVCIWICIAEIESTHRFGLFDMPGTLAVEERLHHNHHLYECSTPPCPTAKGWAVALLSIAVLLGATVAVSGFKHQAEAEQASMSRTIQAVGAVADLLSQYDVDTVAEMLQEAKGQLPEGLHDALQRLEQNLRLYRPYLPAALFRSEVSRGSDAAASVIPGSLTNEAAIVFTDIRTSTAIWEAAPDAMKLAMQVHNTVLRKAIAVHDGYEVKTIGDAFMVAFEDAVAAISFGLAVHSDLLHAEWPAALMEVSLCRPVEGLWGGLTVRIGVNHGPVTVETNALTGRVDYLGHTVNVAARLEGVCLPGAVALPHSLWKEVSDGVRDVVSSDTECDLKGISKKLDVTMLLAASLRRRTIVPMCTDQDALTVARTDSFSFKGAFATRHMTATVGSASFGSRDSIVLEALVPLLEQSGGTILTLLGSNCWLGWNTARPVSAHAENAFAFSTRAMHSITDLKLGLASGEVQCGELASPDQRFVTVAGNAVEGSLSMWRLACRTGKRFLYTAEERIVSGALRGQLCVAGVPHELAAEHTPHGVYEMY